MGSSSSVSVHPPEAVLFRACFSPSVSELRRMVDCWWETQGGTALLDLTAFDEVFGPVHGDSAAFANLFARSKSALAATPEAVAEAKAAGMDLSGSVVDAREVFASILLLIDASLEVKIEVLFEVISLLMHKYDPESDVELKDVDFGLDEHQLADLFIAATGGAARLVVKYMGSWTELRALARSVIAEAGALVSHASEIDSVSQGEVAGIERASTGRGDASVEGFVIDLVHDASEAGSVMGASMGRRRSVGTSSTAPTANATPDAAKVVTPEAFHSWVTSTPQARKFLRQCADAKEEFLYRERAREMAAAEFEGGALLADGADSESEDDDDALPGGWVVRLRVGHLRHKSWRKGAPLAHVNDTVLDGMRKLQAAGNEDAAGGGALPIYDPALATTGPLASTVLRGADLDGDGDADSLGSFDELDEAYAPLPNGQCVAIVDWRDFHRIFLFLLRHAVAAYRHAAGDTDLVISDGDSAAESPDESVTPLKRRRSKRGNKGKRPRSGARKRRGRRPGGRRRPRSRSGDRPKSRGRSSGSRSPAQTAQQGDDDASGQPSGSRPQSRESTTGAAATPGVMSMIEVGSMPASPLTPANPGGSPETTASGVFLTAVPDAGEPGAAEAAAAQEPIPFADTIDEALDAASKHAARVTAVLSDGDELGVEGSPLLTAARMARSRSSRGTGSSAFALLRSMRTEATASVFTLGPAGARLKSEGESGPASPSLDTILAEEGVTMVAEEGDDDTEDRKPTLETTGTGSDIRIVRPFDADRDVPRRVMLHILRRTGTVFSKMPLAVLVNDESKARVCPVQRDQVVYSAVKFLASTYTHCPVVPRVWREPHNIQCFATQADVVRTMFENEEERMKPFDGITVLRSNLGVGRPLLVLPHTVSTLQALVLMSRADVRYAAVVDDEEKLVAAVDIRQFGRLVQYLPFHASVLMLPVLDFFADGPLQASHAQELVCDLVHKMVAFNARCVFVVDADGKPVRVVSHTDIVRVGAWLAFKNDAVAKQRRAEEEIRAREAAEEEMRVKARRGSTAGDAAAALMAPSAYAPDEAAPGHENEEGQAPREGAMGRKKRKGRGSRVEPPSSAVQVPIST